MDKRMHGSRPWDEAHERSLNTDILFGLLKMLVTTRKPEPLRLVITSATLESEKFSLYFNDCPVYHVPGRVSVRGSTNTLTPQWQPSSLIPP